LDGSERRGKLKKKVVKLYTWHIAIADYLARDKDRAEAIVEAAFKDYKPKDSKEDEPAASYHIAKVRSDKGVKKGGKGGG
jgi:hypothetical protein